MPRSVRLRRVIASLIALLVSLSAPSLAVAHGVAHEHLAHEHGSHEHDAPADHEDGGPTLAPADHHHEHGHAAPSVAPGARESVRLDVSTTPVVVPESPPPPTTLVVVRSAALTDRALLARPDPESGPPPRLRAPPVG